MNETNQFPAWYQSSQGPHISATIKSVAALLAPALSIFFGVEFTESELLNNVIDAAMILGIGGFILWGHIRAKINYENRVASLQSALGRMESVQGARCSQKSDNTA